MESEAKYQLVGAFVVICTLMFVCMAMWLSNKGSSDYNNFTVYFRDQSCDGLQIQSWVTMKGIRVGSVESVQISNKNIEEVRVVLRVDKGTPVKVDTRAVINRNLLTGLAWVDLVGSSEDASRLKRIEAGEDYPIVLEGKSKLEAVASTVPQLMNDLTKISSRLTMVLSDDNLKAVSNTLANVESISGYVADKNGDLRVAIKQIRDISADLKKTTDMLAKKSGSIDKSISEMSAKLSKSLSDLDTLILTLNSESSSLSESLRGSLSVAVQEIGVIAKSMNQAAQSFSTTAESLSDIRTTVLGPTEMVLGPGERIK